MKSNFNFIIGVSGVVGAGKNLFAAMLREKLLSLGIKSEETSFAFELRKELAPIIKKHFGYDVWTTDREEKEKFRNLLIYWADTRRKATQGAYFYKKIEKKLNSFYRKAPILIITDARFAEYDYDEVDFVRENGLLVHVSKYSTKRGKRIFNKAPNPVEKFNDPKVRAKAEYLVKWPDAKKLSYSVDLSRYVDEFIDFLKNKNYIE